MQASPSNNPLSSSSFSPSTLSPMSDPPSKPAPSLIKSILKPSSQPHSSSLPLPSSSSHVALLQSSSRGGAVVPPFKCDLRFRNVLPDIPFDPKFLPLPFPNDFLSAYSRQSTLERHHKWKVHLDPPPLSTDQLIDPFGEEEFGKRELAPNDRFILRKEGDDKRSRQFAGNREEKSWLQKPVYITTSSTRRPQDSLGDVNEVFETQVTNRASIEQEFEAASDIDSLPPHAQNIAVKKVYKFVPSFGLRQLELYVVRFDPGEKLGQDKTDGPDDAWRTSRGVLFKRNEIQPRRTRPGPNAAFDPMTLLLPKRLKASEDEDDLFAEDNEDPPDVVTSASGQKYDPSIGSLVRDYKVAVTTDPFQYRRLAIVLKGDTACFVELQRQSLKLARSRITHPGESSIDLEFLEVDEDERERRANRVALLTRG